MVSVTGALGHRLTCAAIVCFAGTLTLPQASASARVSRVVEIFDAKPNGQTTTATASLPRVDGQGAIDCTFKFAVVGGTNEKWDLALEYSDGSYVCTAERQGGSYLFFMHFELSLGDAGISHVEAYDNKSQLPSSAYTIAGSSVSSSDSFGNALARLVVVQ